MDSMFHVKLFSRIEVYLEAYSGVGKNHLRQQVENQKEHAI